MKSFGLSPRQMEAVRYTAYGLTARQASEKMGCSEQSVKNFLYFARIKLRASNNANLIYLVFGAKPDPFLEDIDRASEDIKKAGALVKHVLRKEKRA